MSVCRCRGVIPEDADGRTQAWIRAEGDSSACQLQSFNCCSSQIFLKHDPESSPPGKDTSTSWFL